MIRGILSWRGVRCDQTTIRPMSIYAQLTGTLGVFGHFWRHPSSPANRVGACLRFLRRSLLKRVGHRVVRGRWRGFSMCFPVDSLPATDAYYLGYSDFWEMSFLERFL